MAFVQIIDSSTDKPEALQALTAEYEKATTGKNTARRSIVARDRNDPSRHVVIVFFDSYESAMENSALPETQALSETMGALLNAPPVFHDLDIIEDRSF
jgi:hypothetical protein